jgi:hypothetical protein
MTMPPIEAALPVAAQGFAVGQRYRSKLRAKPIQPAQFEFGTGFLLPETARQKGPYRDDVSTQRPWIRMGELNLERSLLWLDGLDIKSHPYCFFYRDQPIVRQARRKLAEGCGTAVRPGKMWRHARPRRHCAAIGRFKCSSHTSTRNCEGLIDG